MVTKVNSIKFLTLICIVVFTLQSCSGGGEGAKDKEIPTAPVASNITNPVSVSVMANKAEATFTVTDANGKMYTGSGKNSNFSGLPEGNVSINFSSIDGYCVPGNISKTASAGNTVLFEGKYKQGCYSNIIVTTNHPKASFTIIGPETYSGSGLKWEKMGIPEGSYTITYYEIPEIDCYETPPNETRVAVPGSILSLSGEYDIDCQNIWYKDTDGDGYSDGTLLEMDLRPSEYYYNPDELDGISGDKNDNDATIYPGAIEINDTLLPDTEEISNGGKENDDTLLPDTEEIGNVGTENDDTLLPDTGEKKVKMTEQLV